VAGLSALVIAAGEEYGPAYLVEPFARPGVPLVWVWFQPEDADDPVAIGNRFADAVNRVLGNFVPTGAPWPSTIRLLSKHLKLLSPLDFAVFGVEHATGLVGALLTSLTAENRILLQGERVDPSLRPPAAAVLACEGLRVGTQDLAGLVSGIPHEVLTEVVNAFEGKLEPILIELHRKGYLPPPLRPTPEGPELLVGTALTVDRDAIIDTLIRHRRWEEAFELAVRSLPERVPDTLVGAGPLFLERGEHRKLFHRLSKLSGKDRENEEVLFWHLAVAARLDREHELATEVANYLKANDAPRLRALYAATFLPPPRRHEETLRAAQNHRDVFTLYVFGTVWGDESALREALALAEREARAYDMARIASSLAGRLYKEGRLREARRLAEYALEVLEANAIGDPQLRAEAMGDLIYYKVLTGDADDALVARVQEQLPYLYLEAKLLVQSTLAEYAWVIGDQGRALDTFLELWKQAPRFVRIRLGHLGAHLFRTASRRGEALDFAESAYAYSRGDLGYFSAYGELAMGIALFDENLEQAGEYLEQSFKIFSQEPRGASFWRNLFYLAGTHVLLGATDAARNLIARHKRLWSELSPSAWGLFAPREIFDFLGPGEGLVLRFLGRSEAQLYGEPLALRPSYAEILALLALHPNGCTLDELVTYLGQRKNSSTVKAHLSRLRKRVPIASRPYRLDVPLHADFLVLRKYLKQGRIREAVSLYQGPLLAKSSAPAIEEERWALEEELRQAVLASGDGEALFTLAERIADDLELWQASLESMDETDPRRPIALAYVRRLQRDYGDLA